MLLQYAIPMIASFMKNVVGFTRTRNGHHEGSILHAREIAFLKYIFAEYCGLNKGNVFVRH